MRIAMPCDVVSPDQLLDQLRRRYPGLVQTTTWSERALRYDPDGTPPRSMAFVTLQERDSADDVSARLDARGAYRLSFGVVPARYHAMFGPPPAPDAAGPRDGEPAAVDTLAPHPVHAWMAWAAVVNPSPSTMARLWPLLDESFAHLRRRHAGDRAAAGG